MGDNRVAQLVCLVSADGTCEYICMNTLYLISLCFPLSGKLLSPHS